MSAAGHSPDGADPHPSPGPQPPIRAVLIDFGGVLYHMPDSRRLLRWLRFFGVRDPGPIAMAIASPLESELVMNLMTGRVIENDLWERLARDLRVRPALLNYFRQRGVSPKRLDLPLLTYIAGLRPRCRTAILTNAGTDFRATFVGAYALERYVEQVIISAEEGLAKPDPRLYQLAIERLGVRPEETIFVDDIPENVASAQKLGMHAFVHESSEKTLQRLKEIL
jgi:epoxide hydrolase-like predicted phosphatase